MLHPRNDSRRNEDIILEYFNSTSLVFMDLYFVQTQGFIDFCVYKLSDWHIGQETP
jgi:hypothetical protein